MSVWTTATFDAIYKERYQKGVTTYLAKKSPFFSWFKLETDHGGDPWKIVFRTGAVRGAANIADALAERNSASYDEAQPDYAEEHVVASVNMKATRRTQNNANAMVKAVEQAVDAMLEELMLTFEFKLASNGGGARGQIASGIGTTSLVLADASTAYRFARGMKLQASTSDGTTAGTVRVAEYEIASIDPSTGTLTFTTTVAAPWAVNDHLFRKGDFDNATQTTLQGMQAWNPKTTPTTTLFGLTRTNHQGALGGTRVTQGAQHILDVIRESTAVCRNNRGAPDTWWVNPLKMAEIDQAVGAKQEFEMQTDYPGIGLKGLRVSTPSGTVSVLESSAWSEYDSMLTKRDTWIIGSIGPCPHPVDDDGQLWHLEALEDALQCRHRAYPQLGCTDPKHSCNITLSA